MPSVGSDENTNTHTFEIAPPFQHKHPIATHIPACPISPIGVCFEIGLSVFLKIVNWRTDGLVCDIRRATRLTLRQRTRQP